VILVIFSPRLLCEESEPTTDDRGRDKECFFSSAVCHVPSSMFCQSNGNILKAINHDHDIPTTTATIAAHLVNNIRHRTCLLLHSLKKTVSLTRLFLKSSPSREGIELSMMLKSSCDAATTTTAKGHTPTSSIVYIIIIRRHHLYSTASAKPTNPFFPLFFSYKSKFAPPLSLFLNLFFLLLFLSYFCGSR